MAPRVAVPTPRNGDRMSDGGLCAYCRDEFLIGEDSGDALVDCLAPPFSFFLGPPANWERKGAGPAGMMVIWRDWKLVLAFHHLGMSVTSVVQVSVTRGQSRHVTEVTSTDLTKSKVMTSTVGGSAAVQFRNLISDFWVEPW